MVNALLAAEPGNPVANIALAPRTAVRAQASDAPVIIEYARGSRLFEIEPDWRDLLARALEPNVFMHPALIAAAEQNLPGPRVTLLAWQRVGDRQILQGLWAFAVGVPAHAVWPASMLLSPPVPHGYLATPVLDAGAAEAVLPAMLDHIAGDPALPKAIALDQMRMDGATMQALARVLDARGAAPFVLAEARRPILKTGLDGKQYFEQALSASSRKKLRQHRRRLAEKGELVLDVYTEPQAVRLAFEEFLALEAGGWKGRRGTALAAVADEAAYARAMVANLAERGDACVYALSLDGRPVSIQVVLRAGSTAFTWKTAYDEAMHDHSPGMLLLEDYTKAFLADDTILSVDSCAFDESGFMSVWSDRQVIGQVWIDARPGRSLRLLARGVLQKSFLDLRAVAKAGYLSWRRKWKKS